MILALAFAFLLDLFFFFFSRFYVILFFMFFSLSDIFQGVNLFFIFPPLSPPTLYAYLSSFGSSSILFPLNVSLFSLSFSFSFRLYIELCTVACRLSGQRSPWDGWRILYIYTME